MSINAIIKEIFQDPMYPLQTPLDVRTKYSVLLSEGRCILNQILEKENKINTLPRKVFEYKELPEINEILTQLEKYQTEYSIRLPYIPLCERMDYVNVVG